MPIGESGRHLQGADRPGLGWDQVEGHTRSGHWEVRFVARGRTFVAGGGDPGCCNETNPVSYVGSAQEAMHQTRDSHSRSKRKTRRRAVSFDLVKRTQDRQGACEWGAK